jgi:hypothetical protein
VLGCVRDAQQLQLVACSLPLARRAAATVRRPRANRVPVNKVIRFLHVGAVNNGRKTAKTSIMGSGRGMIIPPSVRSCFGELLSYLKRSSCLIPSTKMYKVELKCFHPCVVKKVSSNRWFHRRRDLVLHNNLS